MKKVLAIVLILVGFTGFSYAQSCISPLGLSGDQNAHLFNYNNEESYLEDHFDKEFMLVEMVQDTCTHCLDNAEELNNDQDFIDRTSGVSSCNYTVIAEEGKITSWVDKIGGPTTHVGENSYEIHDQNFFDFPINFGGETLEAVPTFFIINRGGELVSTKIGEIPPQFYDVCIAGQECSGSNVGTGHNEGGEVGTGSCATGGSQEGEDDGGEDNGGEDDGGEDDGGEDDGGEDDGGEDDGGEDDGGEDDGGEDDGGEDDGGEDDGGEDDGGEDSGDDGDDGSDGEDPGGDDSGSDSGDTSGDDPGGDPGGEDDGGEDNGNDNDGGTDSGGGPEGNMKIGRLQVNIPGERFDDIVTNSPELSTTNSQESYYTLIKIFTEWLWIGLGLIMFIVIIYAGFSMLFAIGNAEKFQKALRVLLYGALGLGIAILAYSVMNLLVNLF